MCFASAFNGAQQIPGHMINNVFVMDNGNIYPIDIDRSISATTPLPFADKDAVAALF